MAREINIDVAPVFEPLLAPARYKGAWGGRGGGKSHFMAEMLIVYALTKAPFRAVCIREVQLTLKQSSKRLIEDKLNAMGLGIADGFEIMHDSIKCPQGGIISFVGMQDQNAENIKSLEGYQVAWVEESQTLSARSLQLLRPTIRADNSELWFTWNARRKTDPVDALLRGDDIPTGAVVVKCNWQDNPKFPAVLEQERVDCKRLTPDQYGHIWEGEYSTILVGAYYALSLTNARSEGRFGVLSVDPLLPIKIAVDIGGTGSKSDAFTMWAWQNVGREIRVLNYYEAVGQPLATHAAWLRHNKYTPDRVQLYLPHDGVQHDKIYSVTYESALQGLGYDVTVIKNQGAGAAQARIECARRMFSYCWFDEDKTRAGVEALGWYHEKIDENRQIGLGAEHDWSSHGADSFGLLCIVSDEQIISGNWSTDEYYAPRRERELNGYSRAR